MRLLIDTHVFISIINQEDNLSNRFRNVIENPEHRKYLSIVSFLGNHYKN